MILVTGAGGHLGANLLRRLAGDGEPVRALLHTARDEATVAGLDIERLIGDLRDPAIAAAAVRGCRQVHHCAAKVATDYRDREDIFACNVLATRHLLQAALAAFHPDTVALLEKRRDAFHEQRDFLLPELRSLGFDIPVTPEGAFYIYANCERLTSDSYSFCWDVLEKAGVAIAPGLDFGNHLSKQHVRFSYPKSIPVLQEGVARIRKYLGSK